MSRRNLNDAIENPGRQIEASKNNTLGQVFWALVSGLQLNVASFTSSLNRFVRNPANNPVQTARKRSEKASNLTSELTNTERLTWSKFIEGLRAIEIIKMRVTFEVWRKNGRTAKITVEQDIAHFTKGEDEDDSTVD